MLQAVIENPEIAVNQKSMGLQYVSSLADLLDMSREIRQ
jgi:hypothetical protein